MQSNDNLENFIRQQVQLANIEFVESDWLKLEQQLNQELPRGGFISSVLKKFWYVILVLVLLPFGWFTFGRFAEPVTEVNGMLLGKVIHDNEPDQINNSQIGLTAETNEPEQENNSIQLVSDKSDEIIISETGKQFTSAGTLTTSSVNHSLANTDQNIGYVVTENGVKSGILDFKLHFLFAIPPAFSISNPDISINYDAEPAEIIPPKKSTKRLISVGIGYSPDFSTVGNSGFVSPGTRWTIVGEVAVFNRLLINTGVVWVNNKYEAYGEDYHAPSRYWKKGIVANEAYGECKMIDIPLNLRYNFFVKGKNQLFASAGASTYFVLKEDYYFHYDIEDPDLPEHWGTDEMTAYPFAILNFSLGFQHDLSAKSSFQVEPFVKIPTTGIGWGNVDLNTIGIYFMYKYKIGNQ